MVVAKAAAVTGLPPAALAKIPGPRHRLQRPAGARSSQGSDPWATPQSDEPRSDQRTHDIETLSFIKRHRLMPRRARKGESTTMATVPSAQRKPEEGEPPLAEH